MNCADNKTSEVLRRRIAIAAGVLVLVIGACVAAICLIPQKGKKDDKLANKFATRESVVLIILDTVRSDHLSACGYERPTTPFLERLMAQADGFPSPTTRLILFTHCRLRQSLQHKNLN